MSDTDDMWHVIKDFRQRITALEQTSSEVEVHGEILDDLRNRVYALEHGNRYVPVNEDDDMWDDEP